MADRSAAERLPPCDLRALVRAVDLAAITEATDQCEDSTQGASEAAQSRNLRRHTRIPTRVSGRGNRPVTRSKIHRCCCALCSARYPATYGIEIS